MLPTHTAGAHTVLWTVVLLYVFTVDQSLYVCAVNLCWPMRGQAILRVSWSAVLSINKTSISSCMKSKQLSSQNNSSFRGPGSWVLYCNAWRLSSVSWGLYLVQGGLYVFHTACWPRPYQGKGTCKKRKQINIYFCSIEHVWNCSPPSSL